ncbi:VOC family protein [Dactylosporangium sucinum]|uniref:Glyoxalase-like domain-containing protein n=1 Tax=Dactylosporangium sucinum TaxID=1424081 RepID=A0A917UD56_9ACTN|nr:VOC family protein [Dactylosporangium sucinum]GGM84405.1 hypothetical protein GCM10007977_102420 [Dactylosporangium sucinum]
MTWTLTIDCADARRQAEFWCLALGYVPAAPPRGWDTWEARLRHFDVPADLLPQGARAQDRRGRHDVEQPGGGRLRGRFVNLSPPVPA